jgi:hypothetical protein
MVNLKFVKYSAWVRVIVLHYFLRDVVDQSRAAWKV